MRLPPTWLPASRGKRLGKTGEFDPSLDRLKRHKFFPKNALIKEIFQHKDTDPLIYPKVLI